jgi:phosphate transport system permease protein
VTVVAEPLLAGPDRAARERRERSFTIWMLAALTIAMVALLALLFDVLKVGVPRLDGAFLTDFPSRVPEASGAYPAIMGSLWVIGVCAAFAIPVGMAAAIYLEQYAKDSRLNRFIEINIANLAGIPSVIYGLLGLAVFVRFFGFGRSVLAGGLTLGLLVLPVITIAGREAIRAVPPSIKEAALAVGATEWQAISRQVLPAALPGFMTGVILAISRALGETAPLITMGALTFVTFVPNHVLDRFTALPIQVFNWTSRPQDGFRDAAAAGIVVLLIVLLTMNAAAIWLRNRYQRRW